MSANNVLILKEINGRYFLTEEVAEEVEGDGIMANLGDSTDLKKMMLIAQEYLKMNEVEYGLNTYLRNDEKITKNIYEE